MATRLLRTAFQLPLPREEVFAFFADARNLERITPDTLRFEILPPVPGTLREGTLIDYRLRLGPVPFRWRSLISLWDPPHAFVDQMVTGPYAYWHHLHRFTPVEGGTRCEDVVHWRLPMEPFGGVAAPMVRGQLRKIFSFRERAIRSAFGMTAPERGCAAPVEFALA